jgi:aminoglycoside phosphotransferase (APT) family kinase protein
MPRRFSRFPDLHTLTVGLNKMFGYTGSGAGCVTVLDREPNLYASTFPSEIVNFRLGKGRRRRVLCKYAARQGNSDYGHRGGVAYEADVYRRVLEPLRVSKAKFFGLHKHGHRGKTWMVLEFLQGGWLMDETPERDPELRAARWIGRFHAANEARLTAAPIRFLKVHDADYYRGWARRAARIARPWEKRLPWLNLLYQRFKAVAIPLLTSSRTVIHGEFYPLNIIVRGGAIYPIDWESAAIAAGEIDLASLTESWPAKAARRCQQEYCRYRWPDGPSPEFERRLAAAQLYLALRWLADRPLSRTSGRPPWYLKQMHSSARRLGLI